MIPTDTTDWDHRAPDLVLRYRSGLRPVWDNTVRTSPWLNLTRNAMNTQVWSFRHPDFLCVSATHGSAHLALYDDDIWRRYRFRKRTKNQFTEHLPLGTAGGARQSTGLRGCRWRVLAPR